MKSLKETMVAHGAVSAGLKQWAGKVLVALESIAAYDFDGTAARVSSGLTKAAGKKGIGGTWPRSWLR